MKKISSSLMVASLLFCTGCQPMNLSKMDLKKTFMPWSKSDKEKEEEKSKFETPHRLVAIWSDTVRSSAGHPPTRGFGGRLYFYNNKGQAIPVEGELTVYAFDDSDEQMADDDDARVADRKFKFTAEQFTSHFDESAIGASYSVWLPWDAVGGEQTKVTLLPVFQMKNRQPLMGPQTANVLGGKKSRKEQFEQHRLPPPHEGQTVSYQQPASGSTGMPATSMRTTTFNVPRGGAIANLQAQPNYTLPVQSNMTMPPGVVPFMPTQTGQTISIGEQPSQTQLLPSVQTGAMQTGTPPMGQSAQPAALEPSRMVGQPQPPTHFSRSRFPALGAPAARPGLDRNHSRLAPATQPYAPQPAHSLGLSTANRGSS